MAYGYEEELPKTLEETLSSYNSDALSTLARVAWGLLKPGTRPLVPIQKAGRIRVLMDLMTGDEALRRIYGALNELEQAAVREAVHGPEGPMDWARFRAKYRGQPDSQVASRFDRDSKTSPLCLLLTPAGSIPADLLKRLGSFVPPPRELAPETEDRLPEGIDMECPYVKAPKGAKLFPLAVHETDRAALHDVEALLRMVDAAAIGVSPQTGRVTEAGAKAIRKVLLGGDFYPESLEADDGYDVRMTPAGIRPFAWPLLLQAGGLATVAGGKLTLTRAGRAALARPAQEVLRDLWQRWLGNKLLHEMNRMSEIKGQGASGHPLAAAPPCREEIAAALEELPPGRWIGIEAFFRFLVAAGHDFSVARNAWLLYIGDKQYGSFGYNHVHWGHLNGRFGRCFLLEYGATLGLVDVALTPPWGAVDDLRDFWGTDSMSCLSRYDGLHFLRLNPLGAWILGSAASYEPAAAAQEPALRVLPNLEIVVSGPALLPVDRLFLDRIGEMRSERVWRLSERKLLEALEDGRPIRAIQEFLAARSGAELPQPVASFLAGVAEGAGRLRDAGPARLVECADEATAALVANDPKLRALCLPAGRRHLAVFGGKEAAFRRLVRSLGYAVVPSRAGPAPEADLSPEIPAACAGGSPRQD